MDFVSALVAAALSGAVAQLDQPATPLETPPELRPAVVDAAPAVVEEPVQATEDPATFEDPALLEDAAAIRAVADRVFDYIESIDTMRGRFLQLGPYDELQEGAFYLRRPGRIRFEYDPPNPLLVVADGSFVVVEDRDLETTDRAPIRATPLKYLLRRKIDRDALQVVAIEETPDTLAVTVSSDDDEAQGALTLVLAQPALELRQWSVTDPQGLVTTVSLSNLVRGERLDPALFVVRDERRFGRGR